MNLFLTILSGVAWTVVYIDAIRVGFRDKSYAIPAAALALNIAWEAINAVHSLSSGISVQGVINLAWALADVVIVYTFLKFGRRELPGFVTRRLFIGWAVLLGLASFAVQGLFIAEFDWDPAARYSAFLQNLLMSGLFIAMFAVRRGLRGQTVLIAVAKWIGTLAPHHHLRRVGKFTVHSGHWRPVQRLRPDVHRAAVVGQKEPGGSQRCPGLRGRHGGTLNHGHESTPACNVPHGRQGSP